MTFADIPTQIPDAAATSAAVAAIFVMMLFLGVGVFVVRHWAAASEKSNAILAAGVERQGIVFKAALDAVVGEMRSGMTELKEGLVRINESIEERSGQDQALFDKQLDVVVRVTESLGTFGVRVAENTRKIGELETMTVRELNELKAAIRDIQQRGRT